jgi:penicillin-binding protein 1B
LIVWVGFDDNTNMPLTGAQAALPVWVNFMKKATALRRYRDTMPFEHPKGVVQVEIDADTGMLAGPFCPNRKMETYIDGGEPELCTAHGPGRLTHAGFFGSLFGLRGSPAPPASPPIANGQPSANAPGAAPATADTPAGSQEDEVKKKRGIFSRIFGLGKPKDPPPPVAAPAPNKPKEPNPNQ